MICGLSPDPPASVAAVGIVASLNVGPVIVARPGIGTTAVLLKNSAMFWVIVAGLQAPVVIDVPKEELGTVAPGRAGVDMAPVIATALLASIMALGAAALEHVVIDPAAPAEIAAAVPGTSWIAPSGLAPGVGIVPGTLTGGAVGPAADDVVPDAGALRVDVDLCCANVEPQPNRTSAAVMKIKLRIGGSCVRKIVIAVSSAPAPLGAAPCCRRRG
jgi:hypothetical protein